MSRDRGRNDRPARADDRSVGDRPQREAREESEVIDDLVPDVPPEPSAVAGTPLRRRDEEDPYGIDIRGTDVVHSDTVGAAELSAEYTADHATEDTEATATETTEAWREAAADSLEPPDDTERPG